MISGIKKIFFGNRNSNSKGQNIILTGIPRSGTTLACKILLNDENQIALNEPIAGENFKQGIQGHKVVEKCFTEYRKSLLKNGTAPVRTKEGQITDNAYSENSEKRDRVLERTMVKFEKPLLDDFTLIMKHCAEFTLILPSLQKEYECFAMIRNPLATLASWNSVNVPVSKGKVAKSQILLPSLHDKLESLKTLEEKQLHILNWYYDQYMLLDRKNIITYEALIESQGKELSVISKCDTKSLEVLSNKNKNELYDKATMTKMLLLLIERGGSFSEFYSNSDIEELANNMEL